MSSKPSQTRTIDPFAPYNSNVANRLTRMLSQNDNVLLSRNSLSMTLDSTSPLTAVMVQTGTVIKDDVLIEVTADHRVDFTNSNHYINFTTGFDEVGYYYVVLEYTYVKSRPAPDVDIKILKPSQRSTYTTATSLFLLGVVKVINVGIAQGIDLSDPLHNFDPDDTDNRREYVKFYAGTETSLPSHVTFRDQSRMAYDSETDKFWLGYEDRWEQINAGAVINIDTTGGIIIGDLAYIDTNGNAQKAILTTVDKRAEIAVLEIGFEADGTGQGRTYGLVSGVPVQTAITMNVGDVCYLSSTEAGKVTNVKNTQSAYQNVGKCVAVNGSEIDLLFIPGDFLNISQTITATLSVWTLSGGRYYADVDTTSIGTKNAVVAVRDTADDFIIQPSDLQFTSNSNLRVWMDINTLTLSVTVVG